MGSSPETNNANFLCHHTAPVTPRYDRDIEQRRRRRHNDGRENFSSKVNSRCFKIHYSYSMSVNLLNIVEIFRA